MVTVPSGWTSHLIVNVFPAPRFAGTLLVMKRRTAGCCVPGSPGKMAMSYEPRLHGESWIITETLEVQNLEHPYKVELSWNNLKNMSHLEISILWHRPMLIQSWRKSRDPLATHKQSIPCRVCRKQVLRMSTCLWEHLTWYLIAHWKVNDLQYPILCMKHWILWWNPVFDANHQTLIRSFVKNLFSSLPILKGIWDTQTSIPKTPNLEKLPPFQQLKVWNKGSNSPLELPTDWNLKFEKKKTWKSSWWFQPIWKISVKMGIFPK